MFLLVFGLLLSICVEVDAAQYNDQTVTAYTAYSNAQTYHGTIPRKYITAAVRPKTCGSAISGTRFPYGTYILPVTPIAVPGSSISRLTVEDMGDVYCNSKLTAYWFDIYFGLKPTNDQNAINFGIKKVSYNVIYPTLTSK